MVSNMVLYMVLFELIGSARSMFYRYFYSLKRV